MLPKTKIAQEIELEKIHKELEELKREKKSKETNKDEELTLAQQMLIMHYLGLLNQIDLPNTKKSVILSKLLNRGKDQIRINLSKINSKQIKNKENLEVLLTVFKEIKMTEIVEKLTKDIARTSKNQQDIKL